MYNRNVLSHREILVHILLLHNDIMYIIILYVLCFDSSLFKIETIYRKMYLNG